MEGSHLIVFWNKVLVIWKICEILFNIVPDITWTNFWHGLHFYLSETFVRQFTNYICASQYGYFVPLNFSSVYMCVDLIFTIGIGKFSGGENIYYSLTFTTIGKLIFTDQFTTRDFYSVQNVLQYLKLYTFIFTHEEFYINPPVLYWRKYIHFYISLIDKNRHKNIQM